MDVFMNGLGAVYFYQTQAGVDRVVIYTLRSLKPSDKIYPTIKQFWN